MPVISVPATSANLGPGFDTLGLALDIFDAFTIDKSDEDRLYGADPRFSGSDNLFLQAFHKTSQLLGTAQCVQARFACDIPVSHGLGSSAALIVAGAASAYVLANKPLDKEQIFAISASFEHHPDNAAPAVFGGLTAAMMRDDILLHKQLSLHEGWQYAVCIPKGEVSTEKARAILPPMCERRDAATSIAGALLVVEALRTGDVDLLQKAAHDKLHEPYRATLIPHFDDVKKVVLEQAGGMFVISGSGSTCLSISAKGISHETAHAIERYGWTIRHVHPSRGLEVTL